MEYILGYDIGGTQVKFGLFDSNYQIIESGEFHTPQNGEKIINEIIKHSQTFKQTINKIGISTAGIVNTKTGKIIHSANIPNYQGMNVIDTITNATNKQVRIDNDVNIAAIAEQKLGNLHNVQNGLMITLGTGIGGALIINHEIYRGSNFAAGEVGHHFIDKKTWEQKGSVTNYINKVNENNPKIKSSYDLLDKAQNKKYLDEYYKIIAKGIFNLAVILDIEVVVIGGGITKNSNFDLEKIYEYVMQEPIKTSNKQLKIKKAKLYNQAGIYGAAMQF